MIQDSANPPLWTYNIIMKTQKSVILITLVL